MSKLTKNIINQLINHRFLKRMSQEQLAEKMHTTSSSVSRLESHGKDSERIVFHSPTIDTLEKYADAVGCEFEFILNKKIGGKK